MARPPLRVIKAGDALVNAPPPAEGVPVQRPEPQESPAVREMRTVAAALRERAAELLAEAAAVAEKEVSAARCYAEEVIAQALAEVESIRTAAHTEAYDHGQAAGFQHGLAGGRREAEAAAAKWRSQLEGRVESAVAGARAAAAAAAARYDEAVHNMGPEVIRLALAAAYHILRQEVSQRPDALVPMVAAALERMRGEAQAQVWVSPGDLAAAEARRAQLRTALGGGQVELVADASLPPGDFLVQSQAGTIEGLLEQQLARVATALIPGDGSPVPGDGE